MFLRTRFLFNKATDASEAGGGAETTPAALNDRQKARLNNLPGEVRNKIIDLKTEAMKQAQDPKNPEPPAGAMKPAKEPKEAAPAPKKEDKKASEGVIDFAAGAEEGKAKDGEPEEFPEGDVSIEGLDAEGAKKLKELNHKQQTFRKRTQEAERIAKEAADKAAAAEARLAELTGEIETLRTAPASSNWYASVTDEKQLDQWAQYAQAGLKQLQKDSKSGEFTEWTFPDGTKRELKLDDFDLFTTALDHVEQQREALGKQKSSRDRATSIIARMKGVEGYEDLHRAAQSVDWDHDRPTLAAKLAVAELALSGKYVLHPRSAANSEKAPAAKSAGTSPAEMAPSSASQPQRKEPPAEIAGTMPAATRGEDFDGLLSAAKARAAKGDKNAVTEMLRIKRQRRLAQAA